MTIRILFLCFIMLLSSVSFACSGSVAVYLRGDDLASTQGKVVQVSDNNSMVSDRQGKVIKNGLGVGKHHVKVILPNGKDLHHDVHLSCGENVRLFVNIP